MAEDAGGALGFVRVASSWGSLRVGLGFLASPEEAGAEDQRGDAEESADDDSGYGAAG